MKRWMGVFLVLLGTACLSAPGLKGVEDRGADPGVEGVEDGAGGPEDVGEGGFVEGVTPTDDGWGDGEVGMSDAETAEVGPPDVPEVPEGWPDDGGFEAVDVPDGWVCAKDEDCIAVVGPLGTCEVAVCVDGQCTTARASEGTPCPGDGNPCTVDRCTADGTCVHEPITCLEPPANACEGNTLVTYSSPGQCDRGECEYPKSEKACAQGCTVEGGVAHCVGEDPCAGVTCEEAPFACLKVPGTCQNGSCVFEYDDGASCDDQDACSTGDRCQQGVCVGQAVECLDPPESYCKDQNTLVTYSWPGQCDGGECTYPTSTVVCEHGCEVGRDGKAGCVGQDPCAGVDCSVAPSPCLRSPGACVGGQCVFAYNDGAACEDGDLCTEGDVCEGGECLSGKGKDCEDGNLCTDDVCNPGSGLCESSFNQAPCDDGKACTTEDQCSQGSCTGTPVVCNDPPDPTCSDFQHPKIYTEEGECQEPDGQCTYDFTITECRSGWCQYGYCTGEGMTVVGFFEAGGGEVSGSGLTLRGTLGGWTEGGYSKDGTPVLSVGW